MTRYTKSERKQIHQAFVAAKSQLSNDKPQGICAALNIAYFEERRCSPAARDLAFDEITNRLGRYHTIYNFIYDTLGDPGHLTDVDWQTYRHRWIDSLIEEFSK